MADIADLAQSEEYNDRGAAIFAALCPPAGCEAGPYWDDGVAYCRECDDIIPEKRLKAMPGTGLCVSCAERLQAKMARANNVYTPHSGMYFGAIEAAPKSILQQDVLK